MLAYVGDQKFKEYETWLDYEDVATAKMLKSGKDVDIWKQFSTKIFIFKLIHEGKIIFDVSGEEREGLGVIDLLDLFKQNQAGEALSDDSL